MDVLSQTKEPKRLPIYKLIAWWHLPWWYCL